MTVNLDLPTVGGDNNDWGTKLNAALADVQTALNGSVLSLDSPAFTGTPTKGGSPLLSQADANGVYVAGKKVSTDGSHGLPTPTGVGLEFVFTVTGLDDIRYDGVSQ